MNYEDIYILKNAVSDSEIDWFKTELENLKNNPESNKPRAQQDGKQNRIYVIKSHNPLSKVVEERLRKDFPFKETNYLFHSLNFYELQIPYGLHCDNLGAEEGFFQAIIPLEIKPNTPTYTIIFDQTSDINTEWISPIYKKPKDYKPFHNTPIYDPTWYGNWSDGYKISEEDGLKYWGETWNETFREAYKGFSIKFAYEWNVGDIFLFNSKYNHCAAELGKLNIEQKSGLLACLKKSI